MRPRHIAIPVTMILLTGAVAPASGVGGGIARAASGSTSAANGHHQYALSAPGGSAGDLFGSSVAINKRIVVVGAPYRTVHGHRRQGAAYVFVKPRSGWAHAKPVATLTVAKGHARDYFGASVAVSGRTIAVGAPFVSKGSNSHEGAVYLFTEPAAGWSAARHPTGRLFPSDRTSGDTFGASLAASSRTFVVGAPLHLVGQHARQGSAYVYVEPHGGWLTHNRQTAELTAADGEPGTEVGYSVAVSGRTVVAGAVYAKVGSHAGAGAVYVFTEPRSGWRNALSTARLTVRHAHSSQYLGYAVAVSGRTIAAGAPDSKVGHNKLQGLTYVFTRPETGGWKNGHQQATLSVRPGVADAYVGEGVAASGRRIIASGFGLVSIFDRPSNGWRGSHHQQVQLSGTSSADLLGPRVAMSGSTIVAGAPTQTIGKNRYQGAAYVYVR